MFSSASMGSQQGSHSTGFVELRTVSKVNMFELRKSLLQFYVQWPFLRKIPQHGNRYSSEKELVYVCKILLTPVESAPLF